MADILDGVDLSEFKKDVLSGVDLTGFEPDKTPPERKPEAFRGVLGAIKAGATEAGKEVLGYMRAATGQTRPEDVMYSGAEEFQQGITKKQRLVDKINAKIQGAAPIIPGHPIATAAAGSPFVAAQTGVELAAMAMPASKSEALMLGGMGVAGRAGGAVASEAMEGFLAKLVAKKTAKLVATGLPQAEAGALAEKEVLNSFVGRNIKAMAKMRAPLGPGFGQPEKAKGVPAAGPAAAPEAPPAAPVPEAAPVQTTPVQRAANRRAAEVERMLKSGTGSAGREAGTPVPGVHPPVVDENAIKSVVESAGGKFKGIQKGMPAEGELPAEPAMVYFDEPTGSTLAMSVDDVTPETVRAKLDAFKAKYGEKPAAQGVVGPTGTPITTNPKEPVIEPSAPAQADDALIAEARRYKTADEFSGRFGVRFHGTTESSAAGIESPLSFRSADDVKYGDAIYMSDNASDALSFGHERSVMRGSPGKPKVVRIAFTREPKLYSADAPPSMSEIGDLKKQGYDGFTFKGEDVLDEDGLISQGARSEIVIWNKGIVRTEKNLTEIWRKAHEGDVPPAQAATPPSVPPTEPPVVAPTPPPEPFPLGIGQKRRKLATSMSESDKVSPKTSAEIMASERSVYTPKSTDEMIEAHMAAYDKDPAAVTRIALGEGGENIDEQIAARVAVGLKLEQAGATDPVARAAAREYLGDLMESSTDLGRAVKSLGYLHRFSPTTIVESFINKVARKNAARLSKEIAGGYRVSINSADLNNPNVLRKLKIDPDFIASLREKAARISAMPNGIEKTVMNDGLMREAARLMPSPWYDKYITEPIRAGLLSGFGSWGVNNPVSNVAGGVLRILNYIPSKLVDKSLGKVFYGGEDAVAFTGKGLVSGFKKGSKEWWQFVHKGYNAQRGEDKWGMGHTVYGSNKIDRAIDRYVSSVHKLQAMGDMPMWRAAYENIVEEMRKIGVPEDVIPMEAAREADRVTYQNKSALAKAALSVQRAIPVVGKTQMPFLNVPISIFLQTLDHVPTAFIKPAIKAAMRSEAGASKQMVRREFAQSGGREVIGATLMALGAHWYKTGRVKLNARGQSEVYQNELEGRQPYSFRAGDKSFSFMPFGHTGPILAFGFAYQRAMEEFKGDKNKAVMEAAQQLGYATTAMPFLKSISNAVDVMNDPDRNLGTFFQKQSAMIVPSMLKDFAVLSDKYERQTRNKDFMTGATREVANRVPYFRQTQVPIRRTVLGDEITRNVPIWMKWARVSEVINDKDPVVNELRRLMDVHYNSGGEKKTIATPLPHPDKFRMVGKLWDIGSDAANDITAISGRAIKRNFAQIVRSPIYKRLNDEQKANVLNATKNIIREVERFKYLRRAGALTENDKTAFVASNQMKGVGVVDNPRIDLASDAYFNTGRVPWEVTVANMVKKGFVNDVLFDDDETVIDKTY